MKAILFHLFWIFDQLFGTQKFNFAGFRKKLFQGLIKAQPKNNLVKIPIITIEEIGSLKRDQMRKIFKDTPLIIRNGLKGSPALEKWDWNYLKSATGEVYQSYVDTNKHHFNSGLKPTKEIIENVLGPDPTLSILFGDMMMKCPALLEDMKIQDLVDESYFGASLNNNFQFFLAGKDKETDLHAELGSSLSFQIVGNKEWYLFNPRDSLKVFPEVSWRMYLQSSYLHRTKDVINGENGIELLHGELAPGDILYIPAFYWHCARPLSPSVSVSRKWTKLSSFIKHPMLSLVILSSRNPSAFTRLPLLRYFSKLHPPEG